MKLLSYLYGSSEVIFIGTTRSLEEVYGVSLSSNELLQRFSVVCNFFQESTYISAWLRHNIVRKLLAESTFDVLVLWTINLVALTKISRASKPLIFHMVSVCLVDVLNKKVSSIL